MAAQLVAARWLPAWSVVVQWMAARSVAARPVAARPVAARWMAAQPVAARRMAARSVAVAARWPWQRGQWWCSGWRHGRWRHGGCHRCCCRCRARPCLAACPKRTVAPRRGTQWVPHSHVQSTQPCGTTHAHTVSISSVHYGGCESHCKMTNSRSGFASRDPASCKCRSNAGDASCCKLAICTTHNWCATCIWQLLVSCAAQKSTQNPPPNSKKSGRAPNETPGACTMEAHDVHCRCARN